MYIAAFDYLRKILLVLSVISGGVSIDLFATVLGSLLGITRANLIFLLATEFRKKL